MGGEVATRFERVRESILDAAKGVFARFGFAKTTMEDIARIVHRGKSTIYHYFKDKIDLFRGVVQRESEALREEVRRAVEAEQKPEDKLRAYFLTRTRVLRGAATLHSALKDAYLSHHGFIERIRQEYREDEAKTIREILALGVERGSFEIEDVTVTASAIVAALKGVELPCAEEGDTATAEAHIDSVLGTLLRGILRR